MNSYYVRPVLIKPPATHTVIIVPFWTTRDKLAKIDPMFSWLTQTAAFTALLRNTPDAMIDAEIFEAKFEDHIILFIKQRHNTSIKQLVESSLFYAMENEYPKIEVPVFDVHNSKNVIKTMIDAILRWHEQSGIEIDVVFALIATQVTEIRYCVQKKIKKE